MIKLSKYKGKKVAVFGLGKSGIGAIKALSESGAEVYASDDKQDSIESLKKLNIKGVVAGNYRDFPWQELDCVVLSPGVPLTHPEPHEIVKLASKQKCKITCDIELLWEANPKAKYVAITGTNGKSTTTALIAHILKTSGKKIEVGGNIGISVLELSELDEEGIYVLEVSSYQLDLIDKARFNVSVLLNITPDHLDRHGNMAGYIKAKNRIFNNQKLEDYTVIGIDDNYSKEIYEKVKTKFNAIAISNNDLYSNKGVKVLSGKIYDNFFSDKEKEIELGDLYSLPGAHNAQNIAAAYSVCKILDVSEKDNVSSIKSFPGLKHRIEKITEIDGILFVNDSKATNADAAEKALLCFDEIYWIVGGLAKEGGIESLNKYFPKIKYAFLVGKAENEFSQVLEGSVKYIKSGDIKTALHSAIEKAKNDLKSGVSKAPVILLSPACASFDQWKSYEERGDKFREMVMEIKADGKA